MGKRKEENSMRKIFIEKVTLHCTTADPEKLERCKKLLKWLSGMEPKETKARKRIPAFKIRRGLVIGYKVTLRGKKAIDFLKKILKVKKIEEKMMGEGTVSLGVKEYIEIPDFPYQRDIGILGFDVNITLARKGFRVERKKAKKSHIPKRHKISKEETIKFFENFMKDIK